RRNVIVRGCDAVLCEIARLHLDLAASAGRASAAYAFDIDAELARGVEERRADWKAPALARRHEENERIRGEGSVHGWISALCPARFASAASASASRPCACCARG